MPHQISSQLDPSYSKQFYKRHQNGMVNSAQQIIPILLRLISPKSVVDVGCGEGAWLSVWERHGVSDILGIDGNYVDRAVLQIPQDKFLSADLKKTLRVDRKFDLVVSLEVAEHLPAECAEQFVDSLTSLGKVILFSAAVPLQGGFNHINEQWPEYWDQLFQERNYVLIDCIRRQIWKNRQVEPWYAQNTLLYVQKDYLAQRPDLVAERERTAANPLSLVHPVYYMSKISEADNLENVQLSRLLRRLPAAIINSIRHRVSGQAE